MSKLILLGGAPGIGKSTVIQNSMLGGNLCLDADQIWEPHRTGDRDEAIATVSSIVRECLVSVDVVLLAWIFAKSELFQPFVEMFSPFSEIQQVYLVCEPEALMDRLRNRNTPDQTAYALEKLELIEDLPFDKIDTTNKEPEEIAKVLKMYF